MNLKKRHLIIVIFIIIINTLIYINNKQKTTFRYLIWDVQSVTLGKIINISFISGFLISITLNKYLITKEKKTQPPVNLE